MGNLYLQHHGVDGQKWGVRHYQNPDGSLTPEGRAHYGYGKKLLSLVSSSSKRKIEKVLTKKQRKRALRKADSRAERKEVKEHYKDLQERSKKRYKLRNATITGRVDRVIAKANKVKAEKGKAAADALVSKEFGGITLEELKKKYGNK